MLKETKVRQQGVKGSNVEGDKGQAAGGEDVCCETARALLGIACTLLALYESEPCQASSILRG